MVVKNPSAISAVGILYLNCTLFKMCLLGCHHKQEALGV